MVGILLSYWEGNFSGAMLNFGGVNSFDLSIGPGITQTSTLHVPCGLVSWGCYLDFGTANPDTTKLFGCVDTASPGGGAWGRLWLWRRLELVVPFLSRKHKVNCNNKFERSESERDYTEFPRKIWTWIFPSSFFWNSRMVFSIRGNPFRFFFGTTCLFFFLSLVVKLVFLKHLQTTTLKELTYPLPSHFWRWFSFSQGGIWYIVPLQECVNSTRKKIMSNSRHPYPKNHGISKLMVWRSQNPPVESQTPPFWRVQWFLG